MDLTYSLPQYSTFYTAQTSRVASHPPHPKDVEFRVTTRFPSKSRHTNPHSTPPHFGDKVENLVSTSKPYFPNVPHITTDEDYHLNTRVLNIKRVCSWFQKCCLGGNCWVLSKNRIFHMQNRSGERATESPQYPFAAPDSGVNGGVN